MTSPLAGPLQADALVGIHVQERLAVGDDQDFVAQQLLAQHPAQHFRAPDRVPVGAAPGKIEVAQQRAQIAGQRMRFVRGRLAERLDDALAAQQRAHTGDPAAPRQVRDEHRHQGNDHAQHDEQADEVAAGIGAAPLDEAHVVHEDQRADAIAALVHRALYDVQRSLAQAYHRALLVGTQWRIAAKGQRIGCRLVTQLPRLVAERERIQALILQRTRKERVDLVRGALFDQVGELLLHRIGDELRARVKVAYPPAQCQPVDERDQCIGEQRQCHHQRGDKPQRQTDGADAVLSAHQYSGSPLGVAGRTNHR